MNNIVNPIVLTITTMFVDLQYKYSCNRSHGSLRKLYGDDICGQFFSHNGVTLLLLSLLYVTDL